MISIERICEWCGHPYYPKHGNQKYCCDDCVKYAAQESSRISSQKYRQRWGHEEKKGTGLLGVKPKDDFFNEWLSIQHEKRRLGLC